VKRVVIVLIVVLIVGGVAAGGFYLGRRPVKQTQAGAGTSTVPRAPTRRSIDLSIALSSFQVTPTSTNESYEGGGWVPGDAPLETVTVTFTVTNDGNTMIQGWAPTALFVEGDGKQWEILSGGSVENLLPNNRQEIAFHSEPPEGENGKGSNVAAGATLTSVTMVPSATATSPYTTWSV
jgi:hypothetical protein